VTRLAKEATSSIPIVMTQANDPVGSGLSRASRPGGNVTGLSSSGPKVSGKRLEILKDLVLRLSRVAALGTSSDPANPQELKETELAAKALGVKFEYIDLVDSRDIEPAFKEVTKRRADAIL
jgi:putative tryptophan/tyrosine transport system substrate-binding protein